MTEQTMPADKAREIIGGMRESMRRAEYDGTSPKFMGSMLVYVAALEALLPPPPRPTLAGMPREERAECRWMQADVKDRGGRYVIANPDDGEGDAGLVSAYGGIEWMSPERVTPRPDLPRLEWPGDKRPTPAPAPALPDGWRFADHWDHGRVIVTTPTPNSGGNVYFVLPDSLDNRGYGWGYCPPDDLTYIDQKAGDANPVKVGDVIESAADPRIAALPDGTILRDCDGEEVVKRGGDWAGLGYIPRESEGTEFGPWTVLHTGQGAGPAPALPDGWRLADHQKYGRVVVTLPEPDRDGYVYYVRPKDRRPAGFNWECCPAAELMYLDQGGDASDAVPESTLAVGSVWGSADALRWACEETGRDQIVALDRAGDAYVWSGAVKLWETSSPMSVNAPFTILHRGKKGDQ